MYGCLKINSGCMGASTRLWEKKTRIFLCLFICLFPAELNIENIEKNAVPSSPLGLFT